MIFSNERPLARIEIIVGDEDNNGQADVSIEAEVLGFDVVPKAVINVDAASAFGLVSAVKSFIQSIASKLGL